MAEYWKSTPKYWCKHCKIFVRDTRFEKTQHENTAKHQGNLKRFLRDLHRSHDRDERESQRAKDEVQRLTGLVSGAPASSRTTSSTRNYPLAASSNTPRQVNSEERKRQIAQLAEMGVAVPEEFRRDMALAGEWETISERKITPRDEPEGAESSGLNVGVRKRKLKETEDGGFDEALDIDVRKGWGSATRHYPGVNDDDDLDALFAKTKNIKRKGPVSDIKAELKTEETEDITQTEGISSGAESVPSASVKKEEATDADSSKRVLADSSNQEVTPDVVFKKRKNKALKK